MNKFHKHNVEPKKDSTHKDDTLCEGKKCKRISHYLGIHTYEIKI